VTHLDDPALWLAVSLALAFFIGAGFVHALLQEKP